ncbi:hypothetical protein FDO65_17160 [Nakamurella flava]|uniref:Uncharacterized protein n=1 Tax=Nakamurella flava TaxID=2576308 RepID=A0A4U6QCK2_9ACTN|nr:hypothetical protein [Nakamurella flava]TKV57857.1 hypothetical protein FDO65_17160 [Nakamurella flava]
MSVGPPPDRHRDGPAKAPDDRAEQVLSQALRVMAGGGRRSPETASAVDAPWWDRATTVQLLLVAVLVGLVVGGLAGIVSLLL